MDELVGGVDRPQLALRIAKRALFNCIRRDLAPPQIVLRAGSRVAGRHLATARLCYSGDATAGIRWHEVEPAHATTVGGPRATTGVGPRREVHTTALLCAELSNAQLDQQSGLVLTDGRIAVVQRVPNAAPAVLRHQSGHILEHGDTLALVERGATRRIDQGIWLGGAGAWNWYHWLIEILPKSMLLDMLPEEMQRLPVIVPTLVHDQMRASLRRMCGGREVVEIEPGHRYTVRRLVWIDSPAASPLNMSRDRWPEPEQYAFHRRILEQLRSVLERELLEADGVGRDLPDKVFLKRPDELRSYNQGEVERLLVSHGYTPVRPELLNLREQIALFRGAKAIVGPTGAAWANLLFARPGTSCLAWMPRQYSGFSAFSNLADMAGVDLRYVFFDVDGSSTGDLYRAAYTVSTDEIANGLPHRWSPDTRDIE